MLILLTNDDGIHAPGLAALEKSLRRLGDVEVVAPATEQSGVGHAITFRTPLLYRQIHFDRDETHWGWAVEGTPADCVKIGITHICERKPDLVVSGINGGFNAGINILYSGTVAAAVEAAFYKTDSFAVSLEYRSKKMAYDRAAEIAADVIEKVLARKMENGNTTPGIYNLNIPFQAIDGERTLKFVPMDPNPYWNSFEKRTDPGGKPYFWLIGRPKPQENAEEPRKNGVLTDLQALAQGYVTLTPLDYNMTNWEALKTMEGI
ncbi:MAG: 5'/3'-nucleotidase SurE [Planctomycetaceae bacterium]|nr:5'/3'-nucleotidase SurE [Planctomycetaceae bacterium]